MFFFSEEERRLILRRLLPQARKQGVAEELRGWRWDQPPLSPIYDVSLAVYEVASQYCPTGRDVYLRRIQKVRVPPSPPMLEGSFLHGLVTGLITAAKRLIYQHGADCLPHLRALSREPFLTFDRRDLPPEGVEDLLHKAAILWEYEHPRIVARVQDALTRQPYIGADALAALALPVTVEHRLNGAFLGLSPYLSVDACNLAETMVLDLKFGPRQKFHRLSTTGYALVMESLYETPVNLGCIVYLTFKGDRLLVERDFHLLDDELRQWFVEERDQRQRMLFEELDPGLPPECPRGCPFLRVCHPS